VGATRDARNGTKSQDSSAPATDVGATRKKGSKVMENPTLLLTFHLDTLELDIDAPTLTLDFAISLLDRAKRLLEAQEKILIAQQVRAAAVDEFRTGQVLKGVKLQ
jgi:hypothetical protein